MQAASRDWMGVSEDLGNRVAAERDRLAACRTLELRKRVQCGSDFTAAAP